MEKFTTVDGLLKYVNLMETATTKSVKALLLIKTINNYTQIQDNSKEVNRNLIQNKHVRKTGGIMRMMVTMTVITIIATKRNFLMSSLFRYRMSLEMRRLY